MGVKTLAALPAGISSGLKIPFTISGPHALTPGGSPTFDVSGSFCTFDGTDRLAGPVSLIDETQMWVAVRYRPAYASVDDPNGATIPVTLFEWRDSALVQLSLYYATVSNSWTVARNASGVGKAGSFAAGSTHTVIGAWTATQAKCAVDGSLFTAGPNTTIPVLAASTFLIGNNFDFTRPSFGDVLWLAMGTGDLTNTDSASLHALGDSDPPFSALPGHPTLLWEASDSFYKVGSATPAVPSRGSSIPATIPA